MFKETIMVFKRELAILRYHIWKGIAEIGERKQNDILDSVYGLYINDPFVK